LRPGSIALFVEAISSYLNSIIGAGTEKALIARCVKIKRPGNKRSYGRKSIINHSQARRMKKHFNDFEQLQGGVKKSAFMVLTNPNKNVRD